MQSTQKNDSILNGNNNPEETTRDCARCGELFTCTSDMNCWCITFIMPDRVREYVTSHFEGCVCRKCLDELVRLQNIGPK
ncbi:MAG: cysteine-rich CWC family protein [Lentimicrobiaceae bacterium]